MNPSKKNSEGTSIPAGVKAPESGCRDGEEPHLGSHGCEFTGLGADCGELGQGMDQPLTGALFPRCLLTERTQDLCVWRCVGIMGSFQDVLKLKACKYLKWWWSDVNSIALDSSCPGWRSRFGNLHYYLCGDALEQTIQGRCGSTDRQVRTDQTGKWQLRERKQPTPGLRCDVWAQDHEGEHNTWEKHCWIRALEMADLWQSGASGELGKSRETC